jgi:hypothetical protein
LYLGLDQRKRQRDASQVDRRGRYHYPSLLSQIPREEKKSFGLGTLLEVANKREKGIIYLDLNCYGTDSYYRE